MILEIEGCTLEVESMSSYLEGPRLTMKKTYSMDIRLSNARVDQTLVGWA
jgi:hypothetical protein